MDPDQFATIVERLDTLVAQHDAYVFLLQVIAVAVCLIWGAWTWRLILCAKNEKTFW